MRKCTKCIEHNAQKIAEKEAELWQDMIKNLMNFTQTSTALMRRMQKKLKVNPEADMDNKIGDPCDVLEQIGEELGDIETKKNLLNMCTCIGSQTFDDDDDSEVTAEIACYKPPKVVKRKRFKYSAEIETKLLAQKKRKTPCQCNEESCKLPVDACLCKVLSELRHPDDNDENTCPFNVCSDITQDQIENIYCLGETTQFGLPNQDPNDPLAWIPKPDSFFPNELPQDDTHPYIIKREDDFPVDKNSLGYELLEAMKRYENNVAQIDVSTDTTETYSEYAKKCIQVAIELKKELTNQDIIGICTDCHANAYIPYIAGLLNGNLVAAFDRACERKQMVDCLENVTPSIMFVSENSLEFVQDCMLSARVDFKIVIFDGENHKEFTHFESYLNETDEGFVAANIKDLESTCLICFSGGYQKMRAACLSHYAILSQSIRMILADHAQPTSLCFLEHFQITSLLVLFSSILNGSTRVIAKNFEAEALWKLVQKYEINAIHLYPHQLVALADLPEPVEDTSSLFYIFTYGGRLRRNPLEKLKKVLLKTLICQSYTHTDLAGYVAIFDFSRLEDSILNYFVNNSFGRPIPGIWYKVLDLKTRKILPPLSAGELCIKSNLIENSYFVNNKEEPSSKSEWISTRDYVYYDQYNCFSFISKIEDLIKYKKTIIVPSELEDILETHPLIIEALVYPVTHSKDGQRAAAVVAVKETEDIYTKDLIDWMNSKVPENERLRGGLKIVSSIPYTKHGRIDIQALFPTPSLKK